MHRIAITLCALTLACLPAEADELKLSPRSIPPHVLPLPTTVSPELQTKISNAPSSETQKSSLPTTNAGWKARRADWLLSHQRVKELLAAHNLRMKKEVIGGVHCFRLTPYGMPAKNKNRLLINIHGGGYTSGAGEAGLLEAIMFAGASRITTIAIDYRMPPDYPFPVPVDDAVAVWNSLVKSYAANKIALFGSSAGGAMVLAVVQRAVAEHLPVPGAVIAGTPWSDLSETGDSYFTNRYADPMVYGGKLSVSAKQYAHGLDLKDPRLSPVYGSFAGFPPTLLLTGTRDLFLSNTIRVDRKLRDAGAESSLIVYEGQTHGAYIDSRDLPETRTALLDMTKFVDRYLAQ